MEKKRNCWRVSWLPLPSCRIILFHPFAHYHNSFILAEKIHRLFKSEYLESGSVAAPPCFSWAHTVCLIRCFFHPSLRSRTFLWPVELIIIAPLSLRLSGKKITSQKKRICFVGRKKATSIYCSLLWHDLHGRYAIFDKLLLGPWVRQIWICLKVSHQFY